MTATSMNDRWDELVALTVASPSVSRLRVAPSSPHDLFIGLMQPGNRLFFWYDVPVGTIPAEYQLPALRAIRTSIDAVPDHPSIVRIGFELMKSELRDVYKAMVNDLIGAISAAPDADSGLSVLETRTERWQSLLKNDSQAGLSTADRRGLIGELMILRQLLEKGGNLARTVVAWTGPHGKHQDFQGKHAAIEVKTTVTKQPQSLMISSERELDPVGVSRLYLAHLSLDERQGGNGESLNDVVSVLRRSLANESSALSVLNDSLLAYGYLDVHAPVYQNITYAIRDQGMFEVGDGFPHITESTVPTGVGDITYRIQLAALRPSLVPISDALSAVVES